MVLRHWTFEQDEMWLLLREIVCDYSRRKMVAFARVCVQAGTVCI